MLKVKQTGAFVAQSLAKSDKPYLVAQISPFLAGGTGQKQKLLHIQILALDFEGKNREYGLAYDIPVNDEEWNGMREVMAIDPQASYFQHLAKGVVKPIPKMVPGNVTKKPYAKVGTKFISVTPFVIKEPTKLPCSQGGSACVGCVDEQSHQYHTGLCGDKQCEVCWGKESNCGHADCKACHPTGDKTTTQPLVTSGEGKYTSIEL